MKGAAGGESEVWDSDAQSPSSGLGYGTSGGTPGMSREASSEGVQHSSSSEGGRLPPVKFVNPVSSSFLFFLYLRHIREKER